MFKYIIQFLIIFLLWNNNRNAKGGWLTSSSILLGIYTICSLFGVIELRIGDYVQPYESRYWLPMLIFDLFLFLFLIPFRQFKEVRVELLKLPNRKFLDIFSSIIIVLSIYSIVFYLGTAINVLSSGALKDLRESHELQFEVGIWATIGSVAAENYVFAIVLFFIYYIIGNCKKRCWLLLISSLSKPIHIFAFVGRDGVIFWLFSFVFCYVFFRPYMEKLKLKEIEKIIVRIGIVLLIPFFMISLSRFSNSEGGTIGSIVSYMGHAFLQGPLFFGIENKPLNLGSAFPLFYEITGIERIEGFGRGSIGEWYSWKFGTFIINLYQSLDLGGLIIVMVFMNLFFYYVLIWGRSKKKIDFGQLIIYLFYFQILSQGVFYFRQYTRGGNLWIITTMVLAFIFHIHIKNTKNPIIIHKK